MVIVFLITIMHINGLIDTMIKISNYSYYEQIIVKINRDYYGIILQVASPYH